MVQYDKVVDTVLLFFRHIGWFFGLRSSSMLAPASLIAHAVPIRNPGADLLTTWREARERSSVKGGTYCAGPRSFGCFSGWS